MQFVEQRVELRNALKALLNGNEWPEAPGPRGGTEVAPDQADQLALSSTLIKQRSNIFAIQGWRGFH
jgi:hypothetical protein